MMRPDILFTSPDSVYHSILGPEKCWGEDRDARTYAGPGPVVAHPPCERWGRMAGATAGQDDGCFQAALASVDRFGGILEHPAGSLAWGAFGLDRPRAGYGWTRSGYGWTCSVEQGHYGHRGRKATWLYYVPPRILERPVELIWGPSSASILPRPGRDPIRERRTGAVQRMCRAERRRTPREFALLLIALASR